MPLNLLQHKSWHVGSAKNQERVRRDEQEARLKEEEEERRMQLADAEKRLQILRNRMQSGQTGDDVSLQLDHENQLPSAVAPVESTEWGKRERSLKKRRRDDDDDIPPPRISGVATMKHKSSDAPLTGPDGHINLFPPEEIPKKGTKSSRNKDYMAEKKQKEEELEAQYTMKLSRPAEPWYSSHDLVAEAEKNKAEALRKKEERVEQRVREENDPMNLMKKGLGKLKEIREKTLTDRRKRDADVGIGLSEEVERSYKQHKRESHQDQRYNRRHRSRSRSRSRRQQRSRSRSRERRRDKERGEPGRRDRGREIDDRRDRRPHRSRGRSRNREKRRHDFIDDSDSSKGGDQDVAIANLRAEKIIREENERKRAEALISNEVSFRKPERWTASIEGGRGKYSKQFGQ